jgi:hypothetical protein
MDCGCKGKHKQHECGKFEGDMNKEEKLKHLKECKKGLLKKVTEIDEAVEKLEA